MKENPVFLFFVEMMVLIVLILAYCYVIRDFNKMKDKDKNDFGNPG